MFAANSRYAGLVTYTVTMPDGSTVTATRLPLPSPRALAGYHRRVTGDRLDLLAARYLKDPTFFWRICDANNAPAPDALNARDLIGIPKGPAGA
jgi:hypothetical protein